MFLHNLKVAGLLSFGPEGVDLPLHRLNVLVGPNASGKSNLIEVLSLLKAAPGNLPQPVKEMGGVREWLWKGAGAGGEARIEAVLENSQGKQPLRHTLNITEHGGASRWWTSGSRTSVPIQASRHRTRTTTSGGAHRS